MQSEKSTYENIKKEETTEKPTKHEILMAKIKMYLLIFVVTGIVFGNILFIANPFTGVLADEFCDKQISYDICIADGISNQPPSAITSTNGTTVAKYCYSDNIPPIVIDVEV